MTATGLEMKHWCLRCKEWRPLSEWLYLAYSHKWMHVKRPGEDFKGFCGQLHAVPVGKVICSTCNGSGLDLRGCPPQPQGGPCTDCNGSGKVKPRERKA